ncbi:MAG TPA: tetratricopeptide repeat protein [Longimicrobium sp.]
MSPEDLLGQAAALERTWMWDEAASVYADAFRAAVAARDLPFLVKVLRGESNLRRSQERHDEAEELACLRLEIARRNGLADEEARAMNLLAVLRQCQGDLEGARALYRAALEGARQLRDNELAGVICLNLGAVANTRGEVGEARTLYLESIAASVRSGNRNTAMMAYNNLGMLCADLREWLESDLYFDRGIEIARRLDDRPMLGKLYANNAEPLIHLGELARAATVLRRAEEIATPLGDSATVALSARFRAVLARLAGDFDEADRHLSRAATLAQAEGLALERTEILGGLARLRWEQGRRDEARAALHEARERFAALGAAREIRRLDEVLAAWETA